MALSIFPSLTVKHTSKVFRGQIYIPAANWTLCIATIAITLIFNNTVSLGNAYGLCVTIVTFITTSLVVIVQIVVWRWNIFAVSLFFLVFAFIDGSYIASTILKVPQGAWFTLVVGIILASLMFLWHWGKQIQWIYEKNHLHDITDVLELVSDSSSTFSDDDLEHLRLTGTTTNVEIFEGLGVFFDKYGINAPSVYTHFVNSFDAVHSVVVLVHIQNVNLPSVSFIDYNFTIFKLIISYRFLLMNVWQFFLPSFQITIE